MRRRQWQEIEDLPACPGWLRDAMTGYLQVVIDQARPYRVAAPILGGLLERTGSAAILDLASGGGGPWPSLLSEPGLADARVSVCLTDIEPSHEATVRLSGVSGFEYLPDPVSALAPPDLGHGVWTMFTGLHHFTPEEVKTIMRTAQQRGVAFAAFEATQRSARGVLISLFIPLIVLLLMPRVRPRRFFTLLLTYLPPLLPVVIWWDGFVSTLRTYTVSELEAFAREVKVDGYEWRVRELPVQGAPIPVLSLVGGPTGVVA